MKKAGEYRLNNTVEGTHMDSTNRNFDRSGRAGSGYDSDNIYNEEYEEKVINAESLQTETTLNEISSELKPGETLILDIGNNYFNQTDEIYDTLVMRGYDVKKSYKNGRNQIIVSRRA